MNAAKPNASIRCSGDAYPSEAIRTGSSRMPCERDAERRSHDVPDQEVDDDRDAERDVVEAVAIGGDVSDEPRRVQVDARDRREAAELRHRPEEVVGDHPDTSA